MEKKNELFTFTGMQKDISVSKHPVNFLYDAKNIRLTSREKDTLLSITNERGTSSHKVEITGSYVGHCLLNQYLVVFSVDNSISQVSISHITRIDLSKDYQDLGFMEILYVGNLGFSTAHPIDAIGSFETDKIQKVYWTDGVKQPRVINIMGQYYTMNGSTRVYDPAFVFDFIPELQLNETVTVKKLLGTSGVFAPGVIQYAFTYYTKYGQETNIFYTTPLYYISPKDRGANPEEKVDNAFDITITNVDTNFDYLRIYSIQRTSINGTPIVKRIQDVDLSGITGTTISYTDTGLSGNSVDPTELLYKGGENIKVGTIEQKDNTLFLGNIGITRTQLEKELATLPSGEGVAKFYDSANHKLNSTYVTLTSGTRSIYSEEALGGNFPYYNQLCSYTDSGKTESVPCSGFKTGNQYRCGVQFQHKTGKWSDPFFIKDFPSDGDTALSHFENNGGTTTIPVIGGTLDSTFASALIAEGYTKVRALIAVPSYQDRNIICQGVSCPTLYTDEHRTWQDGQTTRGNNDLYAQSSWFFRPYWDGDYKYNVNSSTGAVRPIGYGCLEYTQRNIASDVPDVGIGVPIPAFNPVHIRHVEIEGDYKNENKFRVDLDCRTFHSPDIEFEDQLLNLSFEGCTCQRVGNSIFRNTRATIDIQTETPPIAGNAGGEVSINIIDGGGRGLVAGLFYDDGTVEDAGSNPTIIRRLHQGTSGPIEPCTNKWLVYPWQGNGSINNDVQRDVSQGVSSAILKKKVLSNYRYCSYSYGNNSNITLNNTPQVFSSNEVSIVKVGTDMVYQGNINTMLYPDNWDGKYFAFNGNDIMDPGIITPISSSNWWKTFSLSDTTATEEGLYKWSGPNWVKTVDEGKTIGNQVLGVVMKKNPVLMKYKSTPHIVFRTPTSLFSENDGKLPVLEFCHSINKPYGGVSLDALMENTWIPCGEPVRLDAVTTIYVKNGVVVPEGTQGAVAVTGINFEYSWGDTYFQRWECLKTYPFTREDPNQIIEIGSFMLETYVNIDGRYDRNRGQLTNVSPQNFNLLNPVYSQVNNFFSYKILPDDFYTNTQFPNQITWTKEKQPGADVDLWTNITLASTYDMDGSKGEIVSLNTWKDQIYCFQKKGISNILFNSRVQIPTSDGVPIEITNSYKVDGYRYISDGIGCNDKQLVKETPVGIYFIDSVGSHMFHIGEGLTDLAEQCNMTSWFKGAASGNPIKKLVYDDVNHDVYAVQANQSLCFSEKLNQFTGFYDYDDISLIESYGGHVFTMKSSRLYEMFAGNYCQFFGTNKPWELTFISNGGGSNCYGVDKTFTNLEFRASVDGDGTTKTEEGETVMSTFYLPFDNLEVWNEYQHGKTMLHYNEKPEAHFKEDSNALKRKFRIWRCDIPRNNADLNTDAGLPNCFRKIRKPIDRMRNPWLYLRLKKDVPTGVGATLPRTEVHDVMTTFYI